MRYVLAAAAVLLSAAHVWAIVDLGASFMGYAFGINSDYFFALLPVIFAAWLLRNKNKSRLHDGMADG